MKFVFQFSRIILITLVGEILHFVLPFPIPAGIYGLILLLVLLLTGLVKLEQVEQVGQFLVDIMPALFITSAAGLIDTWGQLKLFLLPFLIIVTLSTTVVMIVSGVATQSIGSRRRKEKKDD